MKYYSQRMIEGYLKIAAPELLEMLYQCRATIPIVERPKGLDKAIAKAEGKDSI